MKNSRLFSLIILLIGMYACSSEANSRIEATVEVKETPSIELSLYDRMGGAEGISAIVDDIISTHMNNPTVYSRFTYLQENPEQLEMVKKHMRDFLGAGTGGTEEYTGKGVPNIHSGMNIPAKEFLAVVDDIMLVLDNHNMSDQTKKDMLFILYSFKGQVIEG